jgi:NNP family nitrate/nitrite transporter-like MFS transporter
MSSGATFAIVPFINPRALGSVSGIVGAGGNLAAVAAGFLFKNEGLDWPTAFLVLGAAVTCCSFLSLVITFGESPDVAPEFGAINVAERGTRQDEFAASAPALQQS